MRFLKKIAAIPVALSLIIPYTVFAEDNTTDYILLPNEASIESGYSLYSADFLTDNERDFIKYVADEISNTRSTKIDIDTDVYRIDAMRFGEIGSALIRLIQHNYPEIYYIRQEESPAGPLFYIGYTNDIRTGLITSINPEYEYSEEKLRETDALIEAEVQNIISDITSDMSDTEKILLVHDYIVSNYEYDLSLESRMLDTMVTEKTGVCQGYSYLFKHVMDALGIECVTVPSTALNHMWNKVKADGEWYNIDLTFDDPTPDRSTNILHSYFLVNDEEIRSLDSSLHSTWDALKWDGSNAEISESNRFSNSVLHSIKGPSIYTGGTFFCFNRQNDICKIIFDENVLREDYTLLRDLKWYAYGSDMLYYANVETRQTSYYSALTMYDGKIYFNSPDKIYRYDLGSGGAQGTAFAVYEYDGDSDISKTYFYGIRVTDDVLYGEYTTSNGNGVEKLIPITLSNEPVIVTTPSPAEPTPTAAPTEKPLAEESPTPVFEEMPCEAKTSLTSVTDEETGDVRAEITVEVDIPDEVSHVLDEQPTVKVAKYNALGVFIGFERVTLNAENNTASFSPEDECRKVKTFIWSSYFMPLAEVSEISID